MTGRRYWFVNISPSIKNKVKFANDNTLVAEGIGDVLIMKKDGKQSVNSNVLYIPGMKSNFLSIWQLIKKSYKVLIKDKMMRVLNSGGKLILKASMSQKRTFKIELDVTEHKCLEIAARKDEWLWHYILSHLNFKNIINLKRGNMVSDLPEIKILNKVCEKYVHEKKHKNNFSKDARSKSKATLEIIY